MATVLIDAKVSGEKPISRRWGAMCSNGTIAYLFGGYNETFGTLNDLYSIKCMYLIHSLLDNNTENTFLSK